MRALPGMNDIQLGPRLRFWFERIGIAAGDTLTRTAAPRAAIAVGAHGPDWDAIAREVRALLPQLLIVELPV